MLRKYAKYSIIVMTQLMGLAVITLLIAPLLLHYASHLNQGNNVLTGFHPWAFIGHGLFYIALYCAWPHIIHFLVNRQPKPPLPPQINNAMHARYYLVGTFLLFELLNLLR